MDKDDEERQTNLGDEKQFLVNSHWFHISLMFKERLTWVLLYLC